MTKSDSGVALDVFSKFYAVVLYHAAGSGYRVRWSPEHQAWVRSRDSRGRWHDTPGEYLGEPDAPSEEDRAAAAALALDFIRNESCLRCGSRNLGLHFIAPNIYGDPEIYCVQVPSYTVVESRGGGGQVKHWGSPYGCQSVDRSIDSGWGEPGEYVGVYAGYTFGRPLPARGVINREWCSRCEGAAYNVRASTTRSPESERELVKERAKEKTLWLARELLRYYGE